MMTKMAAGVGAGVGAYEALNKTIQSSQTLTDLFGSATEQAKSSVDSFFSALAQGDFSEIGRASCRDRVLRLV